MLLTRWAISPRQFVDARPFGRYRLDAERDGASRSAKEPLTAAPPLI